MTANKSKPEAPESNALRENASEVPHVGGTDAVWLRIESAAALVDLTPAALRKRLVRANLPAGIIAHLGSSVRIHKARFLAWVASGTAPDNARRIGA